MRRLEQDLVLPVGALDVASAVALLRSRTHAHGWRGPRVHVGDDGTVRLRQSARGGPTGGGTGRPLLDGRLVPAAGGGSGVELRAVVRESLLAVLVPRWQLLVAAATAAACVALLLTERPPGADALVCGLLAPVSAALGWWTARRRPREFARLVEELRQTMAPLLAAEEPGRPVLR